MFQGLRNWFGGGTPVPKQTRAQTAATLAIQARYDNAIPTPENIRNWINVDYYSAKTANNYIARRQLRIRSRYEVANNPFLFGITTSNASDLIGTGPTLQILTRDNRYNDEVEQAWKSWCDCVGFVGKLNTIKLAKTVDGEGFIVFKTYEGLDNPVKLYPCDIEADQVTTPMPANLQEYWVDGMQLDPVTGQPTKYAVLAQHPGDMYFESPLDFKWVDKQFVCQWFVKFRPGQVRGIPVFTSSLDLFNDMRGFRNSVMQNAKLVAQHTVMLETEAPADTGDEDLEYEPFKRVPINNGMQTVLPAGMKASTLDPKQPGTSYQMFQIQCITEACRPLSYPVNLALGTSQDFNFSSAKLDHINYRHSLTVEREDCNKTILARSFQAWYTEAVLCGAIRAYDGMKLPPLEWHWPGFEPLDAQADADADHSRLSNGTLTWREFWAKRGFDWRDVMAQQQREREEIDTLGLQFGEPTKQSVSEKDDDGEPLGASKPERIKAAGEFREEDHPRGDDGKFGEGGGGSGKPTREEFDKIQEDAESYEVSTDGIDDVLNEMIDSGDSSNLPDAVDAVKKSIFDKFSAVAKEYEKSGATDDEIELIEKAIEKGKKEIDAASKVVEEASSAVSDAIENYESAKADIESLEDPDEPEEPEPEKYPDEPEEEGNEDYEQEHAEWEEACKEVDKFNEEASERHDEAVAQYEAEIEDNEKQRAEWKKEKPKLKKKIKEAKTALEKAHDDLGEAVTDAAFNCQQAAGEVWEKVDSRFDKSKESKSSRRARIRAFDESKVKRDDDGKFGEGGGSSSSSKAEAKTQKKLNKLTSRAKELPAKVVRKAVGFVKNTYAKLEKKYGKTGARLVMLGMIAVSPVPVPGTSLLPIALAEGVKQIRKLLNLSAEEGETLDAETLAALIREHLEEFYADNDEDMPEIDDDELLKVAESLVEEAANVS
jgi:capsid protein